MAITARDIEKLKALGYHIRNDEGLEGSAVCFPNGIPISEDASITERAGWQTAMTFVRSVGLNATMADKVRWLGTVEVMRHDDRANGDQNWSAHVATNRSLIDSGEDLLASPEAAIDALFWQVP